MLGSLRTLVAPQVAAAVLRSLYNGWNTQHRFVSSGRGHAGCVAADRKTASNTMPVAPQHASSGGPFSAAPAPRKHRVTSFVSMGAWGHR